MDALLDEVRIVAPKVQAIGESFFVFPDPPDRIIGGVHMPEDSLQEKRTGTVVGVGIKCDLEVGQRVMWDDSYKREFTYDGVTYLVKTMQELVGILPDRAEVQPCRE